MKTSLIKVKTMTCTLILFIFCAGFAFCETTSEKVLFSVEKTIKTRQKTQKNEDRWVSEKEVLLNRYKKQVEKQEELKQANVKLSNEIKDVSESIDLMTVQIKEHAKVLKELTPYLENVYENLKNVYEFHLPFLLKERSVRLTNLKKILDNTQESVSEKYRKVMETLIIEAEYGSSIEVYSSMIKVEEKDIQVKILRLGRLSLFFQSLDHKRFGYFNHGELKWMILPQKYNSSINAAFEIGLKYRPVQLLCLPLGRVGIDE